MELLRQIVSGRWSRLSTPEDAYRRIQNSDSDTPTPTF